MTGCCLPAGLHGPAAPGRTSVPKGHGVIDRLHGGAKQRQQKRPIPRHQGATSALATPSIPPFGAPTAQPPTTLCRGSSRPASRTRDPQRWNCKILLNPGAAGFRQTDCQSAASFAPRPRRASAAPHPGGSSQSLQKSGLRLSRKAASPLARSGEAAAMVPASASITRSRSSASAALISILVSSVARGARARSRPIT